MAGAFLIGEEVAMHHTTELTRRLISANNQLRAAQRDGNYADITTWRQTRDNLLDQLHPPRTAHGRPTCRTPQSPSCSQPD